MFINACVFMIVRLILLIIMIWVSNHLAYILLVHVLPGTWDNETPPHHQLDLPEHQHNCLNRDKEKSSTT